MRLGIRHRSVALVGMMVGVLIGRDPSARVGSHHRRPRHAVRWNTDGTVTNLGRLPGGGQTQAERLNDAGVIVGGGTSAGSLTGRAVRWNVQGVIAALPLLPGGSGSSPLAINHVGTVVGFSHTDNQSHAVRWSPGLPVLQGLIIRWW